MRQAVDVVGVLEHGDISFWFRPSVQPAHGEHVELAVQMLFAVLSPAQSGLHRRLRIGRKRMPRHGRDRFWAVVERVGSLERVIGDVIEDETYVTKTRGERYQPGARLIARGTYAFVQEDDHVRLTYELDHHEGEMIPLDDASHLVLFPARAGASATWTTEGAPSELDREGAEIVLVGAKPALDEAEQHG